MLILCLARLWSNFEHPQLKYPCLLRNAHALVSTDDIPATKVGFRDVFDSPIDAEVKSVNTGKSMCKFLSV